ncbi:PLP-dependent aminotransferase family protein [Burkholderia lata]|uniref:aminotransferase-like domain-containing protein n=1 Tax=Burkholderia lata (strain ATCC 17760 / DSM 23089 / LMG 22485 / NCIMB 9086 / R18194 / 383) TaxID=482957 RepID=UPI001453EFB1|nr:PLP-dependent aminotransferase family protein [Burkholderia lata]VWB87839.1 GntR family transcriptional regulator [Burkholderia lata]
MRLISPWTPRLAEEAAPASDRLVAALAEDILDGKLETGDRLPPHRDLADALRIGVGTVTKAYGILERRGLVRSAKGSGTFVALVQTRRGTLIDLSRNAPPAVMTERLLARTLAAVAKRVDPGLFNDYPPLAGHDEHRRLLAYWFARLGMETDPRRLVLTSGAHHAVSVALAVACGPHGTLFTEAQTYPGAIALARHQGIRLVGVEMDGEGVMPEALDRALAAERTGPAALYVTPTMQNPTTATMGRARREEIVSICRANDVMIIEDDVYALAADADLPPLAMLAPERTFYANSLSKTLNPALRIGGLVAPPSMYEATISGLQATAIMVSPLSCAFMEQWLTDGTAEAVSEAIRVESSRRTALARTMLGDLMHERDDRGYHVWLPMPKQEAHRLEHAARALGVLITPPSSTDAKPEADDGGIRLCLGSPSVADLSAALAAISRLRLDVRAPAVRPAL